MKLIQECLKEVGIIAKCIKVRCGYIEVETNESIDEVTIDGFDVEFVSAKWLKLIPITKGAICEYIRLYILTYGPGVSDTQAGLEAMEEVRSFASDKEQVEALLDEIVDDIFV